MCDDTLRTTRLSANADFMGRDPAVWIEYTARTDNCGTGTTQMAKVK